jgi:hypothetical protein
MKPSDLIPAEEIGLFVLRFCANSKVGDYYLMSVDLKREGLTAYSNRRTPYAAFVFRDEKEEAEDEWRGFKRKKFSVHLDLLLGGRGMDASSFQFWYYRIPLGPEEHISEEWVEPLLAQYVEEHPDYIAVKATITRYYMVGHMHYKARLLSVIACHTDVLSSLTNDIWRFIYERGPSLATIRHRAPLMFWKTLEHTTAYL